MLTRIRCLVPAVLVAPGLALTGLLSLLAVAGSASAQSDDPYLEDLTSARKRFHKGDYAKARARYEEILDAFAEESGEDRPGADVVQAARRGLLEIDLVHGKYAEVLAAYGKLPAAERGHPEAVLLAARVQYHTGAYEAAATALRALIDGQRGGYEARFRLGQNLAAIGAVGEARQVYRAAVDTATRATIGDPMQAYYVARCRMELGGRGNMEQASEQLAAAIRQAPERAEPRIAYARLLFEAYRESAGRPTAEKQLKVVLEQNGEVEAALLLMYRSRSFNMFLEGGKTATYLSRALALNPNSVPGLVQRGRRLIDDRLFEQGAEVLDRALKINPRHRPALAHRATVAMLLHDDQTAAAFRKRALAGRPDYADLDRITGDHLVALYRFKDSVPFFRAALQKSPDFVPAMHGLAKALVYLGQGGEAVELLNRAKELEQGFADSWRANILLSEKRLARDYDLVRSEHFLVLMHKRDRPVLEQYLLKWYEDAYQHLGEKYGYRPQNRVRVEVLHEWVDFSVRTIGFRGFSALGACFGEFVTMVSPSDPVLRRNDFMWSATAWHEYAHVLTLALSKHRVPRWLTEGMSVYEESAKNPSWERGMVRDLLDAYHNQELPPLRLLNRLFRGSKILFGYYQGGLVVEFLAEHHGFDKVVSMLKAYGEDQGTEAIMRNTFGMDSREFDRRFKEWVRDQKLRGLKLVPRLSPRSLDRVASQARLAPNDVEANLQLAWHHVRRTGRRGARVGLVEAGTHLGVVLRQQPDHPMGLLCLGELQYARGQLEAAASSYAKGFAARADDFECRLNHGDLLAKQGKPDAALQQYQAAKACWPMCTDQALSPQLRIARVLREQGKLTEAMMEVKSFCRTTARAFKPRLELAAYERKLGNRRAEAEFLEQAIQIDPFMRSLHEQLGDAYLALGKLALAVREYEVAVAVPPELDRAHMDKPAGERPAADSPAETQARGRLYVKLAKAHWASKAKAKALAFLDRAEQAAPGTELVDEVQELRARWQK